MIKIKNRVALIKSIKRYNLAIIDTKQHGFMRQKITMTLANQRFGTNGGRYRNWRTVTMDFAEAAELYAQGILVNHSAPLTEKYGEIN